MNRILLLTLFLVFSLSTQSQDHIKIGNEASVLYRGASTEIEDWYLFFKEDTYYMCKLAGKREKQAFKWFEARIDSQNLYKGSVIGEQEKSLCLKKENNSAEELNFFFQKSGNVIVLISKVDGVKFTFNGV